MDADNNAESEEQQRPAADRPPAEDGTPNSSPQKQKAAPTAPQENSFYPGCSPVALGANSKQEHNGEMEQNFQENDDSYQQQNNASEFAASASPTALSTVQQNNDNRTEEEEEEEEAEAEEGLLFEDDNSCGEEIARWMEDQRHLQQQQIANGQVQQRGGCDDSSIVLTEPTTGATSHGAGNENNTTDHRSSSEKPSKRPSSAMSNSSSSQKLLAKRRQRSQSTSQLAPPDTRSAPRKRMDHALNERSLSQMALRDALVALEKAKAIVSGCRSRYNAAKVMVENTAKEECESLLKEDSQWNEMFHKLKKYKEEFGDCNVKQNFGSEDNKNSPEMVRRLSAWVGKNRKDGKLRGRSAIICTSGTCKASTQIHHEGKSNEESDIENAPLADPTAMYLKPDETAENADMLPDGMMQYEDNCDDLSVFDNDEADSIHADPYKQIALDQLGFDWDPRNSRWNNMYEELRLYKKEHGNTLVPHANFGLGAWVKRQQVQYTLYSRGDGTKSDLTEERVRLLNDLGFIWSRRTNTWNENFQRLAKWKVTTALC
ncbi:hypothetical protein ACHAXR_003231 [Thalassiosira sp. AJA248-18]